MDPGPIDRTDDGSQLAPLTATLRQIDRLYVQALRQAVDIDGHRAVADEGMTVDLAVQLHTGAVRSDVDAVLTGADALARMPASRRLFEQGVLTWGHVRALVAGTRRLEVTARAALDAHLGQNADRLAAMDPQQRLWALDDAIRLHEPAATIEQRDQQQLDQTFFAFSPRLDGSASGYGEFDPESYTTLSQALEREADTPQAAPPPGDDAAGMAVSLRERPTRRSRQLGEALVRLCAQSVSASDAADARGSGPVRATVIVDLDRVTDTLAGTLQPAVAGRPPRIARRALERLTCDAALDLVVARGHDLLAAKRYAPDVSKATRRAVLVRDGGCRFPGCTAPPAWVEIHHVVERARHLDHAPGNLISLCRRHHQAVHRRGWDQTLRLDGRYTLRRRGRTWTTLPRRAEDLPPPNRDGPVARDGPAACDGPALRDGPSRCGDPRVSDDPASADALPF